MEQPPGACPQEHLENTCPPSDQGMCCERGTSTSKKLSGSSSLGQGCWWETPLQNCAADPEGWQKPGDSTHCQRQVHGVPGTHGKGGGHTWQPEDSVSCKDCEMVTDTVPLGQDRVYLYNQRGSGWTGKAQGSHPSK